MKREPGSNGTPGAGSVEKAPDLQLVKRQCQVCEWEAVLLEPAGSSQSCAWCHAPTRSTIILAQVEGLSPEPGKNPYAAALGRLGGLKGGLARAAALTSKERQDIARNAANKRWGRTKRKKR